LVGGAPRRGVDIRGKVKVSLGVEGENRGGGLDGLDEVPIAREEVDIWSVFFACPVPLHLIQPTLRLEATKDVRSVRIRNQPLGVDDEMRLRCARNGHLWVRKRVFPGARHCCADRRRVQPARLHVITLHLQRCVLVRQLQRLCCLCERERRRSRVWRQQELQLMPPCLVVDCRYSVQIRGRSLKRESGTHTLKPRSGCTTSVPV
jgi:hypothetical protein